MICPFCGVGGTRPELHGHLTDTHGEECRISESWSVRYYQLACPRCDFTLQRRIKPRLQDPGFLEEYGREIRLVAFDMFLYHLEAEHEQEEASA